MTKPGIEVKSQLVFWSVVGTPRVLQISAATAINDSDFGRSIAIKTLMFFGILAKFEDLCVVHVDEYFCDFSLNLLIFCFWLMSLRNCSLCWCFTNISISFVTIFCRRVSCSFTEVLLRVSPLLSASCCDSLDDLASCTSRPCESIIEFSFKNNTRS